MTEEENTAGNGNSLRGRVMVGLIVAAAAVWGVLAAAQHGGGTYEADCAVYHGADGEDDTPVGKKIGVHDFNLAEEQKENDNALIAAVTNGKNKMPAYGKSLNAGQIKELVTYIRTLVKK